MERIKAHLVLGAGGVRTLTYVGALVISHYGRLCQSSLYFIEKEDFHQL